MGYLNETGLARFYAGLKTKFAGKSAATASAAGLMSAADKGKLDGIEAGAKLAPRPNLLDNWYFGNPVNQRGQTSYTGTGTRYTIDRWRATGGVRADVASTGLAIKGSSAAIYSNMANQPLPSELRDALHGKTVTVSMLVGQNTEGSQVSVRIGNATGTACVTGLSTLTLVFDKTEHTSVVINCDNRTVCDFTVLAIKLELGDTQTLARQENGKWVLNELPDYGEQLERCQRYYIKYNNNILPCGIVTGSSKMLIFAIWFPVRMRTTPSIVGTPTLQNIREASGGYLSVNLSTSTHEVVTMESNEIRVRWNLASAVSGTNNRIIIGEISNFELTADL